MGYARELDDDDDEDDDELGDDAPDKAIIDAALAKQSSDIEDEDLTQSLSADQRRDNLAVIRQIFKYDLADLQRRRDYAGWVEAKKDLKKRQAADPWFSLNKKLKEAS